MSPWGHLFFTGWATLAAILAGGWQLGILLLLELACGLLQGRGGLRALSRPHLWSLILAPAALGPFLIGEPDVAWGSLHLSREGLVVGLEMAARALALVLAFGLGVGSLSLSDVVALFDRFRLRGLGFATAVAMNALGTLRDMGAAVWQTIWLRGGMRRPGVALRLFLITTVANTLRYGDAVVSAAAVRAFDPQGRRSARLPLRRADLWLLALLAGCSGLLWAAGL